MIFMLNPVDAAKSTEIREGAACIFLEIKVWVMPISLPKAPESKVYLHAYLKETGRHGFIIQPERAVNKEKNLAFYSAAIVQKVKNIVRVF